MAEPVELARKEKNMSIKKEANMNVKSNAVRQCVACLFVMAAPIVGCSDLFTSPQLLSTELDFVLANGEDFVAPEDSPLANDDPGVVRDELSNLDGCWGEYFETSDGAEGATVFVFDSQDQRIESHIYAKDLVVIDLLLITIGSYSVEDEDRITISWDTVTHADVFTGALITEPAENRFGETTDELLLTLSSDYLKRCSIDDMDHATGIDFSSSSVFTKFECP